MTPPDQNPDTTPASPLAARALSRRTADWTVKTGRAREFVPADSALENIVEWTLKRNPDLIALVDPRRQDPDRLSDEFLTSFQSQPEIAAVADLPAIDQRLPDWPLPVWTDSQFPIALLYPPNPQAPLLVRRSALERIGPLRIVDDPIRDWLIRAALGGAQIGLFPNGSPGPAQPLPLLAPPRPPQSRRWLLDALRTYEPATRGSGSRASVSSTAFRAGLLLWHDFLDESHQLAQSIEGEGPDQLGDYWHAIMHRREPDYSNSKYWFRQFGAQPIYDQLGLSADAALAGCRDPQAPRWRERLRSDRQWQPARFVDLCEACAGREESELGLAARRIQLAEMTLLLRFTWQCL